MKRSTRFTPALVNLEPRCLLDAAPTAPSPLPPMPPLPPVPVLVSPAPSPFVNWPPKPIDITAPYKDQMGAWYRSLMPPRLPEQGVYLEIEIPPMPTPPGYVPPPPPAAPPPLIPQLSPPIGTFGSPSHPG